MNDYEGFEILQPYNGHQDQYALFCKICRENQVSTDPIRVWKKSQVDVVEILSEIKGHVDLKLDTHHT